MEQRRSAASRRLKCWRMLSNLAFASMRDPRSLHPQSLSNIGRQDALAWTLVYPYLFNNSRRKIFVYEGLQQLSMELKQSF